MIIGITGPTGAGKTTALTALTALGFRVLDCDRVYHELLASSPPLLAAIEARFPGTVREGILDRKALGRRVFSSQEELEALNTLTHPFVLDEVRRRMALDPGDWAIDAVALLEGGEARLCDCTVAVTAPEEVRVRRIMAREGISESYARARVASQHPSRWFEERCTYTLRNEDADGAQFARRAADFFRNIIQGESLMTEERRKELLYQKKHLADLLSPAELESAKAYGEDYKAFLAAAKTERLANREAIRQAEKAGFVPYTGSEPLKPGDKIYRSIRGKALYLAVIGERPLEEGVMLCAAHIDSPRVDLKQVPLYERDSMAYFKTHYYGGLRKYQWVNIPLALHGTAILADGRAVELHIGEEPGEPTFLFTDLLPHLGAKQSQQTLAAAVPGENLNLLVGSLPVSGEGSDRVKLGVLEILNEKYGLTEADFLSAELEIVPALPPRDVGFDRSMIASYGQDDRVCAYAELRAICDLEKPLHTAVCLLADKEEIGSVGVTGMQSAAFDAFMEDMAEALGAKLRRVWEKSLCISADVTAGFDPTWPEVMEKQNSTLLNYGVGLSKYTGSRGKSGCNDASAETIGRVRRILDAAGVHWQTGELGKVDEGGGGTVAGFMANRAIDTVDVGTPVLSMHSPYEIVSKLDAYSTCRCMKAVFEA